MVVLFRLLKSCFFVSIFVGGLLLQSQNITVDANSYTLQQLVEEILIDSGCISNVQVTNSVGGNFSDSDKSFGYFSSNGSGFPFQKGLVLSTGKLQNVPGPNSSLSDDDAPGWIGDLDLETALGINNTINATIIEFTFVPNANNIRFRYIFASEEYQQGDPNTCRYSDAFAFLIKPLGGNYTNLALVPGTQTPVQVTTVHSGIPGACPPINEIYFEGWNGQNAPINFNGQTKILIAESPVTINQTYHIKLVIADHGNYRYDSAVFLEGGSFNIAADLGLDRSFLTHNPLCHNESYLLDAAPDGNVLVDYKWFRNNILIPSETSPQLLVSTEGIYRVEMDYGNNCIAIDEVLIEYSDPILPQDTDLFQCAPTGNGSATYNLYNAEAAVVSGDPMLRIHSFHKSFYDAENNVAPISNPRSYTSVAQNEIVFARVVSDYGCVGVGKITLRTTPDIVPAFQLVACSIAGNPGYASFDLSGITIDLFSLFGNDANINFYLSHSQAISETNPISSPFTNTQVDLQSIYAKITGINGCLATAEIKLNVVNTPEFEGDAIFIYCLDSYPETITIFSGLTGTLADVDFKWSTGETTSEIKVNETGTYTVTITRNRTIDGVHYSCSNSKTITVVPSEPPQVSYRLEGILGNQTLVVLASGSGDYVYSLENGPFQQSPVFRFLRPGKYSLTVKDINGCGETTISVYVIGFPKFFTPNNDGIHDHWQIKGLESNEPQLERVRIFDRFGKHLYNLDFRNQGWDGTYRGKPLPSSDYWFEAIFKDGTVHRGHFSLKR